MPTGKVIQMPKNVIAVVSHAGRVPAGGALSSAHAISVLAALAQPTRLAIFRLLLKHEPVGITAGVIADTVGAPHNSISTHLAILVRAGLLRGSREGRTIIYRANIEGMRSLIGFLINDCCDGHPELCKLMDAAADAACGCPLAKKKRRKSSCEGPAKSRRITCCSCARATPPVRSWRRRCSTAPGQGNFRAFSAGSQPKGEVHPYTLDLLRKMHYDVSGARSKSWLEFSQPDSPELDFVFTVCDNAAGEACPSGRVSR